MSECDDVNPNVRDICACTRAGMTLTQCNHRRALWGKPALTQLPGDGPQEPEAAQEAKLLTTVERVKSFVSITAQTIWRVVRLQPGLLTDEQMQTRIDICQQCPRLVAGHCELCGCNCQRENTVKFMNKLAHRDAACPDSPPRWGKFQENSENS